MLHHLRRKFLAIYSMPAQIFKHPDNRSRGADLTPQKANGANQFANELNNLITKR